MSYVSQTPNLGLPQWILSEPPQMSDFNGAFSSIDQFAGEKGQPNGLATLDAEGNLVQSHAAGYKLSVAQGGTGAGDPVNARSNLGMGKLLWSGSWGPSSGSISVPEIGNYIVVMMVLSDGGTATSHRILAAVDDIRLRGLSYTDGENSSNQYIIGFECDRSGTTLSNGRGLGINHNIGSNHGSGSTEYGVAAIYGIC